MLGNVLTLQVFTLLRELTAIDYQKGVNCNSFTLEKQFLWIATKEGTCLYNKIKHPSARNL